jgi:hypothetical protein
MLVRATLLNDTVVIVVLGVAFLRSVSLTYSEGIRLEAALTSAAGAELEVAGWSWRYCCGGGKPRAYEACMCNSERTSTGSTWVAVPQLAEPASHALGRFDI